MFLVAACLIAGSAAFAQDPGLPDSLIIGDAHVESLGTFAFIPIWAVTDDSVNFYCIPLRWNAPLGGVQGARGTLYFPPLTSWDVTFDTLLLAEHYSRMLGFNDIIGDTLNPKPTLLTNGQRVHIMSVRFTIDPYAPSQLVRIDTTYDPINGPITFGITDGRTEIYPCIQPGYISINRAGAEEKDIVPTVYSLAQNYPNPFNPETNIEFSLPSDQDVNLAVYNLLGQQVRTLVNGRVVAGTHTAHWDGKNERGIDVPSGIYFYRLFTSEFAQTNKMVLVR